MVYLVCLILAIFIAVSIWWAFNNIFFKPYFHCHKWKLEHINYAGVEYICEICKQMRLYL